MRSTKDTFTPETDIATVELWQISPSPENDLLYHAVNPDDPAFKALVQSIQDHSVLEPLIISSDGWIISGHRRYAAAKTAARRLEARRRALLAPLRGEA